MRRVSEEFGRNGCYVRLERQGKKSQSRRKPPVSVTYESAGIEAHRLDAAFDVLFEAVCERRNEQGKLGTIRDIMES